MTEEQRRKKERQINLLSMGTLAILILFLIVVALSKKADTWLLPVGIGVLLALHWFFSDVLSVKWLNLFDGKNEEQVKSYYVYAGMELIGFAGLTYFLIDMNSTTGAIVYVATMFLKKKFMDDFKGVKPEEEKEGTEEETEVAQEQDEIEDFAEELEAEEIVLEIPEVRATEEELIAQTQTAKNEE